MGIGFSQLLLILVLVVGVFVLRRVLAGRAKHHESPSAQVRKTRTEDAAVFSAEPDKGKEAEFIRDGRPSRWPALIGLVIVALLGAMTWLFSG